MVPLSIHPALNTNVKNPVVLRFVRLTSCPDGVVMVVPTDQPRLGPHCARHYPNTVICIYSCY